MTFLDPNIENKRQLLFIMRLLTAIWSIFRTILLEYFVLCDLYRGQIQIVHVALNGVKESC